MTFDVNHASRYYWSVSIRTFKCADTQALFGLRRVARFANIERPALRKLKQIDLARRIEDLRAPPANRLEQLTGDRAGQWSIRVNDQFRICFRWTGTDAVDVEIVDYH
jgi:proteic killer suppression protein